MRDYGQPPPIQLASVAPSLAGCLTGNTILCGCQQPAFFIICDPVYKSRKQPGLVVAVAVVVAVFVGVWGERSPIPIYNNSRSTALAAVMLIITIIITIIMIIII